MLTQNEIKDLFEYREGVLYWKIKPCNNVQIGDQAGNKNVRGYWVTGIQRKLYQNHRLIFMWHYGYLPQYIDHINGNTLDNRIENLRPATCLQNQHNAKKRNDNKSGVKGLSWDKQCQKWKAQIRYNGQKIYLGLFESLENAEEFITLCREMIHGEFANHG